jgi:hypothetical protein
LKQECGSAAGCVRGVLRGGRLAARSFDRPHRPTARTPGFQSGNRGSIPLGGMQFVMSDTTADAAKRAWLMW